MRASWRSTSLFNLDQPLLFGIIFLAGIGLIVLYSASGQDMSTIIRQAIRLSVGFGVLLIIAQIRTQHILTWIPWLYIAGLVLLLAVLVVGETVNGSQRWLNIGVRFQPSEAMKLAVPLMVAWFLAEKPLPPNISRIIITLLLIAIPVLLIAKQPDLGTSLLIGSSGIFVLLLAGISWWYVLGFSVFCLASAPLAWFFVLHEYQRQRILTLLNPEGDALGTGYHIIQSKIAIGSGGLYGKGLLNGTQSHLEFLPERSTDFIFAVYSEEFGFFGVLALLVVYTFILTRGMYIAMQAQGTFDRLLAGSLVLTFFVYIFVNMGMVSGLLPVVGLPLPLISYGGTSIVTMMAGFGLLMAIHSHKRMLCE